ncbi:MAG: LuxR C-terminal-related transcriptional regulator [Actinomycetota bacterium]|nr:LuxR C-terminal-related transcriptional regulator [Actinomycetota bacterium]
MTRQERAIEATAVPTGTVTFMLTDIEGSSRQWEMEPVATASTIHDLNSLIDELVARHEGSRPVEQGEGDSAVAAFGRASDAIACALDLQLRMSTVDQLPENSLRVRIGLHTGEAQLRDSGNYFGPSLNRCARVRSVAHGGQTVLSRSTYELIVDRLPEGASLKDLGPHALKDLARPEHIYQLCHPGLDNEFPPLRSLGALPTNLPLQLTTFVGRETEMQELKALLGGSRMVTLTGSGGCGKTRLSIQVAADLVDGYPDGVWWVDLGPITDPALVPNAVASALGIKEVPLQPLIDTLISYLRDKELMILLDNCEHLVESSAALSHGLLTNCPAITVLSTSREPLGVQGETPWRVPSLDFPDDKSTFNGHTLHRFESVKLFMDRAAKARPNFSTTNENAPAVAQICRRLDGIPLAIELAAARIRVLTPEQIASGLDDRFHMLTGGGRTALPRQRTLEASVDWSFNLLDEDEKGLLARLTVFAGGFTLDAAEEVCSGEEIDKRRVLDLLSNLVDKSLVQVESGATLARYRLLESIRYYGMQKLADSGQAQTTRDRHLTFFLGFAESAGPKLLGPDMAGTLETVDAEHDNLRAAMEWAIHSVQPDTALRFVNPLFSFWFVRGHYSEGTSRVQAALSLPAGRADLRAQGLARGANLASQMGDFSTARAMAEDGVAVAREAGSPLTLSLALYNHGWVTSFSDPGAARDLTEEALAILRDLDAKFELSRCLTIRGIVEVQSGELSEARRFLDESLDLLGDPANGWALQVDSLWLGHALVFQGEFDLADSVVRRGIAASRALGDAVFAGLQLCSLGLLAALRGRYEEARGHLEESASLGRSTNSPWVSVTSEAYLGVLDFAEGDFDSAVERLQRTVQQWELLGLRWAEAFSLLFLGRTAQARGDLEACREHADAALTAARDCNNAVVSGQASVLQADLALRDGDNRNAEGHAREALRIFARVQSKWGMVEALEALARAMAREENFEEAARLVASTRRLRQAIGYVRFTAQTSDYENDLALLREALGSEGFETAWAEGLAMPMEQAVDLASRGRGPRKRPTTGWASLTPAELDVARLVARGLTNPQIGEKLFISKRTVQAHLSNVFAKLGISSRAELASETARHDTSGDERGKAARD